MENMYEQFTTYFVEIIGCYLIYMLFIVTQGLGNFEVQIK